MQDEGLMREMQLTQAVRVAPPPPPPSSHTHHMPQDREFFVNVSIQCGARGEGSKQMGLQAFGEAGWHQDTGLGRACTIVLSDAGQANLSWPIVKLKTSETMSGKENTAQGDLEALERGGNPRRGGGGGSHSNVLRSAVQVGIGPSWPPARREGGEPLERVSWPRPRLTPSRVGLSHHGAPACTWSTGALQHWPAEWRLQQAGAAQHVVL